VILARAWLKEFGVPAEPTVRVFCFPYAGGAASMFRDWVGLLPPTVGLTAVQLPGREGRFREPAYDRMGPLVEDLADVIGTSLDLPYVLLGCSMGARVAFSLAHELRKQGLALPSSLVVAASPAPCLEVAVPGWDESDEGLLRYLADLGATPSSVLSNPALLDVTLPLVRADLSVVGSWRYPSPAPLPMPIHAFCGEADKHASAELMAPWAAETYAGLTLTTVPGGHFFFKANPRSVLDTVDFGVS
jgi:surfactin synthase thioesterase subunit